MIRANSPLYLHLLCPLTLPQWHSMFPPLHLGRISCSITSQHWWQGLPSFPLSYPLRLSPWTDCLEITLCAAQQPAQVTEGTKDAGFCLITLFPPSTQLVYYTNALGTFLPHQQTAYPPGLTAWASYSASFSKPAQNTHCTKGVWWHQNDTGLLLSRYTVTLMKEVALPHPVHVSYPFVHYTKGVRSSSALFRFSF